MGALTQGRWNLRDAEGDPMTPMATDSKDERRSADTALVRELLDGLAPLRCRARAMFGAWMIYVDDKPLCIVDNGEVFIKRSTADALFEGIAQLAPPYPGAKDYWLLDGALLRASPDRVRELVAAVADALPAPKRRPAPPASR